MRRRVLGAKPRAPSWGLPRRGAAQSQRRRPGAGLGRGFPGTDRRRTSAGPTSRLHARTHRPVAGNLPRRGAWPAQQHRHPDRPGPHRQHHLHAAAERLTNANLSRNADVGNSVATGREEEAFLTSTFSSVTGQEAYRLTRRASSPIRLRATYGVGTYIRHAPDMPNGFIIIRNL